MVAVSSLVSSSNFVVTSQYKTYGSSVYAGDIQTCTDSTVISTELVRGNIRGTTHHTIYLNDSEIVLILIAYF